LLQEDLVQDSVGARNEQIDAGTSVVVDYVAGSLVEQIEANNMFALVDFGLPLLGPSIVVPDNRWSCELVVINRQSAYLTGPAVLLPPGVSDDEPAGAAGRHKLKLSSG
jgi:hypothetical protein